MTRKMRTKNANAIVASLELASERLGDLTPHVYAALFAEYPEMKPLFWRDTNNAVKGEMLAKVFEIVLDFVGDNLFASNMIQCEVITHSGYDVPPDVFAVFFGIVRKVLCDQLGADWTSAFEAAWNELLAELDYFVTHPDQSETAALS
jgi:hemoglobin-like flavoprotein